MAKNASKLAKRAHRALRSLVAKKGTITPDAAVLVTWEDHAFFRQPSWLPIDDVKSVVGEPVLCTSVGFPVHVDAEAVTLAMTVGDGDCGDLMKILLPDIKEVTPIRRRK